MIEVIEHKCSKCGSPRIVKNGRNCCGNQQYYCKDCKTSRVLNPKVRYTQERKEEILRAYRERASMRGIERIFGVTRQTLRTWIKKKVAQLPAFKDTVQPCRPEDVIEYDELWSFVQKKDNQCYLFAAICRRTHQIVGFALGLRNLITCAMVWREMPLAYMDCPSFSDSFYAYQIFLPNNTCVAKGSGQTSYIEGWNNIIRQRLGRFVRKTCSFSKSPVWHELVTRWFIVEYNLSCNA